MTNTLDATIAPRKTTKQRVVHAVIVVTVLVFVFGWLLSRFIDDELILDALADPTWQDLVVLSILSIVWVPSEAPGYRAMLSGSRRQVGSEADLSSNPAADVMPPGASSVVQHAYVRTVGFDHQSSSTGASGSFVFARGARLALPIPVFLVLSAADEVDDEALLITGISVALVAIVGVLIRVAGRSETSARRVDAEPGRFVSSIMVKLETDPIGDLGDQVVDSRDSADRVVAKRWPVGSVAVALDLALTSLIPAALIPAALIPVASLRAVGIGQKHPGLAVTVADEPDTGAVPDDSRVGVADRPGPIEDGGPNP